MMNTKTTNNKKTLYLHIGAHKTASSLIQALIKLNLDKIHHQGVDVIDRKTCIETDFFKELSIINKGNKDSRSSINPSQKSKNSLKKITENYDSNILITNEDLFSGLSLTQFYRNVKNSLLYMINLAPDYQIRVIFYIRKQADYIESIYLQNIHIGRHIDFSDFISHEIPNNLFWGNVIKDMGNVIGSHNITIIPYESIHQLGHKLFFNLFLTTIGINNSSDIGIMIPEHIDKSKNANRSYSELGIKIANAVNPLLNEQEKVKLRRFIQENFSTATHSKAIFLDEKERSKIFNLYKLDNKNIFEEYIPNFNGKNMGYF